MPCVEPPKKDSGLTPGSEVQASDDMFGGRAFRASVRSRLSQGF